MSLVTATINGKQDTEEIVRSVKDQVLNAGARAVYSAAEFHTERAKRNVWEAYTTAGYRRISMLYAGQLVNMYQRSLGLEELSGTALEHAAREMQQTKQSMILTGELIDGISFTPAHQQPDRVYAVVKSEAPHSRALELGYLFGKYRTGRERPFFTDHLWETKMFMKNALLLELMEEMRNV